MTQQEIEDIIITEKESKPELSALNSTSKVSVWRLLITIVSRAISHLSELYIQHLKDVKELLDNKKPMTTSWLVNKIKNFQFGYSLPSGSIEYDNSGISETLINNSKVVAQCSVTELRRGLRIKVAKMLSGELSPLDANELNSLRVYISKIRTFVPFKLESKAGDKLYLKVDIFYNPMVLNPEGKRLDGMNDNPVEKALRSYLSNLPFNGRLTIPELIDVIQSVDGVSVPNITEIKVQYGDTSLIPISLMYVPDAGYFKLEDLQINYHADE